MEGERLLTQHCRHFQKQDADPDFLTATITCDCGSGWWAGPVERIGPWKSRLVALFAEHVAETEQPTLPVSVLTELV